MPADRPTKSRYLLSQVYYHASSKMPKTMKQHDNKRNELLDAAQLLFLQNGYENTSVADIINAVGKAKGTFYHYFKSKEELLDQIADRYCQMLAERTDHVIADSRMNAIEKFHLLCSIDRDYKIEQRDTVITLVRAFYADENLRLLNKWTEKTMRDTAPKLSRVISQGIEEGVFRVGSADHIAEMLIPLQNHFADEFARIVLHEEPSSEARELFLEKCETYEKAVERILGAPEGSLHIFDREAMCMLLGNG